MTSKKNNYDWASNGSALPKDSVGSEEIKDGSIKEVDLSESVREKLEAASGGVSVDELGLLGEESAVDIVVQAIHKAEQGTGT